jgi:hypothetical protein
MCRDFRRAEDAEEEMNDPERGEGVKLRGCESLEILGADGELFRST